MSDRTNIGSRRGDVTSPPIRRRKLDFDVASINVNPVIQYWGPHSFSFKGRLPDPAGDPIAAVDVKSFLDGMDTTADLISGIPDVATPQVGVLFKYPGDALKGRHILQFKVTTTRGGVNTFNFGYVEVG